MKKVALSALFVVLFLGNAAGHNGSVSLFTDETIQVCNKALGYLETDTIGVYYVRDNGYDLGIGVEFKVESSSAQVNIIGWQWSELINNEIGNPNSGVSLAASQCIGGAENVAFIGFIYVFCSSPSPTRYTLHIVDNPDSQPPAINIVRCDVLELYPVIGGWFVFNGSCNPAVESKSWGAIKELFK
jgi:hypothetical protein